jgi:transposase
MISFSGSLKIFLLVDCCDMRKGFNGLYGLVSSSFGDDPRSGALVPNFPTRHKRWQPKPKITAAAEAFQRFLMPYLRDFPDCAQFVNNVANPLPWLVGKAPK